MHLELRLGIEQLPHHYCHRICLVCGLYEYGIHELKLSFVHAHACLPACLHFSMNIIHHCGAQVVLQNPFPVRTLYRPFSVSAAIKLISSYVNTSFIHCLHGSYHPMEAASVYPLSNLGPSPLFPASN